MRSITISSCNLSQWSLDFVGNKDRIIQAVQKAKLDGSRLLVTPELSVTGYACLDEFLNQDTSTHSWEVVKDLIGHEACQGILVDGTSASKRNILMQRRVRLSESIFS